MRAFGCWSRSRLGAGIGAGAASGGRKSCPRALLPRGPQFRLLGAGPDISVFFYGRDLVSWTETIEDTNCFHKLLAASFAVSSLSFQVALCLAFLRRVRDLNSFASSNFYYVHSKT